MVKRIDVCEDGKPTVVWSDEWVLLFGTEEVRAGSPGPRPLSLWHPRTDYGAR
jgi:hypothetical protein